MGIIEIVEYISKGIYLLSILVIVYGTIKAIISFIKNELYKKPEGIRQIRANFGGYLLLGLEFLIGADILKSVIEPTYQELVILAGIVVLRTVLSVFLNKEIKELEASEK